MAGHGGLCPGSGPALAGRRGRGRAAACSTPTSDAMGHTSLTLPEARARRTRRRRRRTLGPVLVRRCSRRGTAGRKGAHGRAAALGSSSRERRRSGPTRAELSGLEKVGLERFTSGELASRDLNRPLFGRGCQSEALVLTACPRLPSRQFPTVRPSPKPMRRSGSMSPAVRSGRRRTSPSWTVCVRTGSEPSRRRSRARPERRTPAHSGSHAASLQGSPPNRLARLSPPPPRRSRRGPVLPGRQSLRGKDTSTRRFFLRPSSVLLSAIG